MSGISVVIDTNILLYMLNGNDALAIELEGYKLFTSYIVEMELLSWPGLDDKELARSKGILLEMTIFEMNSEIKRIGIDIRKKYHLKLPDAIIAATAIYLGIPLWSADTGFLKVEELNLFHYTVS